MDNNSQNKTTSAAMVSDKWIEIKDGLFFCPECEHEVRPLTNTIDGVVEADLDKVIEDLTQFPTKVIYGVCPVCAMEYEFRLANGKLFLEACDAEK